MLSLVLISFLAAQAFDPKMPPAVPQVTGTVVENFAMRYIDTAIGSGAPALPGKQYTVHYVGWLRNGTKFDSSVDRKEPFKFVQGRRLVIAGWEAGFEGMQVGGKRRLETMTPEQRRRSARKAAKARWANVKKPK